MSAYQLTVYGRVQGVGFRWSTLRLATEMKMAGTVKNLLDGSVQIVIEGPEEKIAVFIEKLEHNLTPFAKVSSIDKQPIPNQNLTDFQIID
ncbi:acylphosphatase [Secundilactobacillus oryzae JCM 18671]|uniref:acylphosphatase n=1 Tax=Secundilactobacillus oryzae JCM 18671 TaxID=1291743 RepID=A0A081BG05_9LACO|nr:acylphosphatase [Secundilactobacillus oryzae]GAK46973.1 acylphosphatase [Secundilactobacillus oryzae JCM 18671]